MFVRLDNQKWINNEFIALGHDRDHFAARWRRLHRAEDRLRYRYFRNMANSMAKSLQRDFYASELEASRGDSRKLWRTLKSVLPNKSKDNFIPCQENITPVELANKFNNAFCSVGEYLASQLQPPSDTYVSPPIIGGIQPLNLTVPSLKFIEESIASLPLHKSTGIDGLNVHLLKPVSTTVARVLHHLYTLSINQSVVPNSWKIASVTPIFKDGDREQPLNYRPISVISVPMKILERSVHDQIESYITRYEILTPDQSGFRKYHSTVTAATEIVDNLYHNMDSGMATAIAFLDLRKAFDTVDRKLLLAKLLKILKSRTTTDWLLSYLSNRCQRTKVNGTMSEIAAIEYGVLQGSILWPLLFILYVNDISKIVSHCRLSLYADDTAIYVHGANHYIVKYK